jgi:hypothetical protein
MTKAQGIVASVMAKHMIGAKDFYGVSQVVHLVKARRAAIMQLSAAGFKVPMIAKVMRRDRSTVRYWLRPDCRSRRVNYANAKRATLRTPAKNSNMETPMNSSKWGVATTEIVAGAKKARACVQPRTTGLKQGTEQC